MTGKIIEYTKNREIKWKSGLELSGTTIYLNEETAFFIDRDYYRLSVYYILTV